jgi:hypothetical protein
VTVQNIIPRDILISNPTNEIHRRIGIQYDPAIEHGKYWVCQPRTRRSISARLAKYDEMYLLFRTTYMKLDRTSRVLVTGYYKIQQDNPVENDYDPTIYAEKMKFVSVIDAIDITDFMKISRSYRSTPTTENFQWAPVLLSWIEQINEKTNRVRKYRNLSNRLKEAFKMNEFVRKPYDICESCPETANSRTMCPLVQRQNKREITDISKYYDKLL